MVKDNLKIFYKYIGNKKAVNEIRHPLLDSAGNILLWHEEMVLSAFSPSVFITRTGCPQATHFLELEVSDGKLNEALIIHEKMGNELCQLDTRKI